jgi:hypothetical protein
VDDLENGPAILHDNEPRLRVRQRERWKEGIELLYGADNAFLWQQDKSSRSREGYEPPKYVRGGCEKLRGQNCG